MAGTGRVAQALGRLLCELGEPVAAVGGRDPEHAEIAALFIGGGVIPVPLAQLPRLASRLLIAVPDDALAGVAALLAEAGMEGGAAVHTCGARGPEVLAPLARRSVSCAVLHPLQTIATAEQGVTALLGAAFMVTGDAMAAAWARRTVTLLGGQALEIAPGRQPLYHAAAVMASNYIVGMVDAAVTLLAEAGIDEASALGALAPLTRASSANATALGPLNALTGPIERGDVETVSLHWKSLAAAPSSVRELYRAAALHLLELARRKGLSEAKAGEFEKLFQRSEFHNA